jgi:hypothetical protein
MTVKAAPVSNALSKTGAAAFSLKNGLFACPATLAPCKAQGSAEDSYISITARRRLAALGGREQAF